MLRDVAISSGSDRGWSPPSSRSSSFLELASGSFGLTVASDFTFAGRTPAEASVIGAEDERGDGEGAVSIKAFSTGTDVG